MSTFKINEHEEVILNKFDELNKDNNLNIFEELEEILEFIKLYNIEIEGFNEFKVWINCSDDLSEESLKEFIKTNNNLCSKLALEWLMKVNSSIKSLNLPNPFNGIKEVIQDIDEVADVVGVSSANELVVNEELNKHNFKKFFKAIACEDSGSKKKIIHDALCVGYERKLTLVVGEALCDYEAALANGVYFFPIIPRRESYSWNKLKNEGIKKLVNYQFDDNYQKQILDEFLDSLSTK